MGLAEIQALKSKSGQPKPLKKYVIPKVSKKKAEQIAKDKELNKANGGGELQRWFNERRLEMKGVCSHCGGKSCKDDDNYFRFSVAHILPKAYFPSVKTNRHNWVELCHFGQSCHSNLDNNVLDLIDLNCFDEIITKFVAMYPEIASKEKRRIPSVLMQYVDVEK